MNFDDIVAYSRIKISKIREIVGSNYKIGNINDIISLSYGVNDVFQINCDNSKYIFRISNVRSFWKYTKNDYITELMFLNFMSSEPNLVCYPISKIDGTFLGEITAPEGTRYFSLFNFASGNPVEHLTDHHAFQYGVTLSLLHSKMTEFAGKHKNINRFNHNLDTLYHRPIKLIAEYGISNEDMDFLSSMAEVIIPPINAIKNNTESFGLIHGDYQVRNSHYNTITDSPVIFDFDYMSFSWRMIDIANFTSAIKYFQTSVDTNVETSFLEGYNQNRKLTEEELSSLKFFEIGIGISVMGQVINQGEMINDRNLSGFITGAISLLRKLYNELP